MSENFKRIVQYDKELPRDVLCFSLTRQKCQNKLEQLGEEEYVGILPKEEYDTSVTFIQRPSFCAILIIVLAVEHTIS
ncbi:hypothetical protein KPH14_010965 [Odynerus spinipes]|uniref:Uncharacterized protein n=1 Tax=Odynerus spinipes TaxID=1348599 RepID=A0AAD9RWC4_9HYME|nr:hypothetical protein KPH14_010965 [Odynerus spinipes]